MREELNASWTTGRAELAGATAYLNVDVPGGAIRVRLHHECIRQLNAAANAVRSRSSTHVDAGVLLGQTAEGEEVTFTLTGCVLRSAESADAAISAARELAAKWTHTAESRLWATGVCFVCADSQVLEGVRSRFRDEGEFQGTALFMMVNPAVAGTPRARVWVRGIETIDEEVADIALEASSRSPGVREPAPAPTRDFDVSGAPATNRARPFASPGLYEPAPRPLGRHGFSLPTRLWVQIVFALLLFAVGFWIGRVLLPRVLGGGSRQAGWNQSAPAEFPGLEARRNGSHLKMSGTDERVQSVMYPS